MYFPSLSASDAGKSSWCSWKSSSHTFHTAKPETFYCCILHFLSKMASFHILSLWKKKKKIATQIFGILQFIAEGKQTFFFRPKPCSCVAALEIGLQFCYPLSCNWLLLPSTLLVLILQLIIRQDEWGIQNCLISRLVLMIWTNFMKICFLSSQEHLCCESL